MKEVNVTLTLADPTGTGYELDEVNVDEALSELVGMQLSDEDGVVVDVFKVERA